ncbi:MAG: hypothetical protein PWQ70_3267 [Clostridiales bacterium]|nr:hypothetical protein [Clostridiales bacterium]
MWYLFDNGSTIGTKGSENGVIIKDEEHESGARITLEKKVNHGIHFAITCGIYGLFVHTVYCSDSEKSTKYESIKQDIDGLLKELNDDNMSELVDEFVNKY